MSFSDTIAEELQKHGYTISWIVVNQKLFHYLQERYRKNNLLFINKKYVDIPAENIRGYKLLELIYGDRSRLTQNWPKIFHLNYVPR